MQLPLTLEFGPSASLQWWQTGGHVLLGMPVLFFLPAGAAALALLALLVSLGWQLQRLRRLRGCRGCLCLRADGQVMLTLAEGDSVLHALGPHSRLWPQLVVLDLRAGPCLLLLPDAFAQPDAYRSLCVWMRWVARGAQATCPDVAE